MADPFALLGIDKTASEAEIRRAWRVLAAMEHPDRNPHDPDAEERFKTLSSAFQRAIARSRALPESPKSEHRYQCSSCGDGFPYFDSCPRCGVALCDSLFPRRVQARTAAEDLELTALLREAGIHPWRQREFPLTPEQLAPFASVGFVAYGLLVWATLGHPIAFALVGFGMLTAALVGHEALRAR